MSVVTLLTDFGTADGYVGEVKGVLYSSAPGVTVADIAHDLPAHDVDFARLTLGRYWLRFPERTVHVVVVDPGVGSERAAIAVEAEGRYLVGPDNGVLSPALVTTGARVVELAVPPDAAPTFHGRDVFAVAAARLANGTSLDALGRKTASALVRRTPEPRREGSGAVVGEVIAIDRFGNAITSLASARAATVSVGTRELRMVRTYADLDEGAAGALVGSSGLIELVVRGGRAVDALGIGRGDAVRLAPP